MMVFRISLGVALGLALPAYVAAQDVAPVGSVAPAPPAKETKICRSIVPTGSVLAKRFCLTKTEWRQFGDIAQNNADNMLRHRGTGMCDISCPR